MRGKREGSNEGGLTGGVTGSILEQEVLFYFISDGLMDRGVKTEQTNVSSTTSTSASQLCKENMLCNILVLGL